MPCWWAGSPRSASWRSTTVETRPALTQSFESVNSVTSVPSGRTENTSLMTLASFGSDRSGCCRTRASFRRRPDGPAAVRCAARQLLRMGEATARHPDLPVTVASLSMYAIGRSFRATSLRRAARESSASTRVECDDPEDRRATNAVVRSPSGRPARQCPAVRPPLSVPSAAQCRRWFRSAHMGDRLHRTTRQPTARIGAAQVHAHRATR
jgi:hypothetical protein